MWTWATAGLHVSNGAETAESMWSLLSSGTKGLKHDGRWRSWNMWRPWLGVRHTDVLKGRSPLLLESRIRYGCRKNRVLVLCKNLKDDFQRSDRMWSGCPVWSPRRQTDDMKQAGSSLPVCAESFLCSEVYVSPADKTPRWDIRDESRLWWETFQDSRSSLYKSN